MPSRALAAAALALALVFAGCGSEAEEASTTPVTRTTAEAGRAAIDRRVAAAEAAVKAAPRSEAALAKLARAHYAAAGAETDPADSTYRPAGLEHLRLAARAWERLLALKPKQPDVGVATMMAVAYGTAGLDKPRKAVAAQLIVTWRLKDAASYRQLAVLAWESGDKRAGDRAADRAVKLTPASERKGLRESLRAVRAVIFSDSR